MEGHEKGRQTALRKKGLILRARFTLSFSVPSIFLGTCFALLSSGGLGSSQASFCGRIPVQMRSSTHRKRHSLNHCVCRALLWLFFNKLRVWLSLLCFFVSAMFSDAILLLLSRLAKPMSGQNYPGTFRGVASAAKSRESQNYSITFFAVSFRRGNHRNLCHGVPAHLPMPRCNTDK